ncbi:MAG: hypothetical protein ACP5UQ_00175 [Anaerolineae bacterium]
MNDFSSPQRLSTTRRLLLVGLLLGGIAVAAVLGLALQGIARDALIMPALFLAWLIGLFFRSVPGWVWWAWFLIIALVFAARSLRTYVKPMPAAPPPRGPAQGAICVWADRLHAGEHGGYFRWRLARDLAELSLQLLAYHERGDLGRGDRGEAIERLAAPPAIAAYLRMGLAAPPWQPQDLRSRLARLWQRNAEDAPLQLDPAAVVKFLEEQLERKHDDQHPASRS